MHRARISKQLKFLNALAKPANNMKTYKNLYKQLLNKERIKQIIILAAKGKKKRREVRLVLDDLDTYTDIVYSMLRDKTFYMKETHNKTILENGKERLLTISPFFPNRIFDYLIVESLKPIIRKSMYEYCVGNVDKRGLMYGKNVVAKRYKKYKYYLKLDIHKFYPSTSSQELLNLISHKIHDNAFIELCRCVVGSCECMPIGSYYSQWLSNWFLQDLDHMIKEQCRIPFYIRYVDDMLLMGNNKRALLRAMYKINEWLKGHNLTLKRFENAYEVKQCPIDFLGFRFGEKIKLRTRNFKKLNKRVKRIRKTKHICLSQARSLMSFIGWLKQINIGYLYYKNHIFSVAKIGTLKKIISSKGAVSLSNSE